ncbi:MAG: ABC transporter ATP-binding protein, partial [Crocinitomicaceae bacterium]|nr:ABC transporter ATP-binding protein [Crocinitomicaceae bacterium]
MLEVRDIFLSYDRPILKKVNLKLNDKEILGLVGKSGAGKSSLLKILSGRSACDTGSVHLDGKVLPHPHSLLIPGYKEIAMVNQDFKLDPYHTVEENIRESVLHLPIQQRDKRVNTLLKLFELLKIANSKAHLISGGEQQRLAIARAISNRPRILVLDEPFGHLDSMLRLKLSSYLLKIREEEGTAIILVSHDGQDVLGLCDSICILNNGILSKKKSAESVYYDTKNPQIAQLFGPLNKINLDGETHFFRPDEYELSSNEGIEINFQRAVFVGGFYYNYFTNKLGES